MTLTLSSSAFTASGTIPRAHTADGKDVSPPLRWQGAPTGTTSFALICDDPDAPVGTWVHWLIWNIPMSSSGLPEGVAANRTLPDGSTQGKNDFGRIGWGGPSPPKGPAHHYHFRLYALSVTLTLAPGAGRRDLDAAMKGRILAQAELVGLYGR